MVCVIFIQSLTCWPADTGSARMLRPSSPCRQSGSTHKGDIFKVPITSDWAKGRKRSTCTERRSRDVWAGILPRASRNGRRNATAGRERAPLIIVSHSRFCQTIPVIPPTRFLHIAPDVTLFLAFSGTYSDSKGRRIWPLVVWQGQCVLSREKRSLHAAHTRSKTPRLTLHAG